MPRVISDELYEDLISNITQQRLLGIMGKLERLAQEAVPVLNGPLLYREKDNLYLQSYVAQEERK